MTSIDKFNNPSVTGAGAINTSSQINSGNSSGGSGVVNVDLKKNATVQDLMNTLGLTKAQAEAFLGEHPNITLSEATQLINQQKNATVQPQSDIKKDTEEGSAFKSTTGENFDFAEFSQEKDPLKKAQVLAEEYTKNLYQDKWDSFTDEEKIAKQKEAINQLLQENNKTDKKIDIDIIKAAMENPEQARGKISKRELNRLSDFVNSSMTNIQTANTKGLTLEEFQKQDKDVKNAQKYALIENLDAEQYKSLSVSDKQFYETEKLSVDAARDFFNEPNLTLEELPAKIKKYNETAPEGQQISKVSLSFETLKQKQEAGTLTQTEKSIYRFYNNLSQNGANLAKVPDFDSSNSTINEMLQSSTYQEALEKNNNDHRTAMKYYLNEQLKGGDKKGLSPEEFDKKFGNLISGCSPAGARELMSVAAEMKKENWIVFKQQNLANNTNAIAAGIENDAISADDWKNSNVENKSMWGNVIANRSIRNGNIKNAILINRENGGANYAEQRKILQEAGLSKEKIQEYEYDAINNADKYTKEAYDAKVRAGGVNMHSSIDQKDYVQKLAPKVVEYGDEETAKIYASSGSTYKGEAQTEVTKQTMEISKHYDDATAIAIQNAAADDIQNFAKENQLEAHNIVMTSSYSEVQERAASNISNYHESVQSDAFKTVLNSGNKKAIENAVTSYDKMADSAKIAVKAEYTAQAQKLETAYTQEIAKEVATALDKLEDGTTKLSEMSTEQRIKYYTDKFVNGKPSERRAMFQKMLDNGMSKDTFKKLVKYCPELLISMMGDLIQRGLGESILNCLGKSSDLTYKVVNAMMSSGNTSDKKVGAKYVTENPTQFSKTTRENAEEILHKLVSNEDNQNKKSYHATA